MKIIITNATLIVTGIKNLGTFFGFPNENKESFHHLDSILFTISLMRLHLLIIMFLNSNYEIFFLTLVKLQSIKKVMFLNSNFEI